MKQKKKKKQRLLPLGTTITKAQKQDGVKETQKIGSVGWNVFIAYFNAVDSIFLLLFTSVLIIIEQITSSYLDFFISRWVKWENSLKQNGSFLPEAYVKNESSASSDMDNAVIQQRHQYVLIYTILIAISIYLACQRSIVLFKTCLKASSGLHNKLFSGIIRAPMYFFNTNSSGRIINRFSKDIGYIDTRLPIILYESSFVRY